MQTFAVQVKSNKLSHLSEVMQFGLGCTVDSAEKDPRVRKNFKFKRLLTQKQSAHVRNLHEGNLLKVKFSMG